MAEAQFFDGLFYQQVSGQVLVDCRPAAEGGLVLLIEPKETLIKNEIAETNLILEKTEVVII